MKNERERREGISKTKKKQRRGKIIGAMTVLCKTEKTREGSQTKQETKTTFIFEQKRNKFFKKKTLTFFLFFSLVPFFFDYREWTLLLNSSLVLMNQIVTFKSKVDDNAALAEYTTNAFIPVCR